MEKGGKGQRGDGEAVGEGEEVAAALGDFGGDRRHAGPCGGWRIGSIPLQGSWR